MRPKRKSYTLSAASATGYVSAATGTGPFTTIAGAPADGLAHSVTLVSTANLSGITMTITGLDAEGRAQTEAIAGPNNNTVTSTKRFKSISRVTASATLGANTMNIGWGAACETPIYVIDGYSLAESFIGVTVGGSITYSIDQTNTDPYSGNALLFYEVVASRTTSAIAGGNLSATGWKVRVSAHTAGVLAIDYMQGKC